MQNLSPHRKFVGPPNAKASFRPFYRHPWPEDLPKQCRVCGTVFSTGWNLTIGPNRIGRFSNKASLVFGLILIAVIVLGFCFDQAVIRILGDFTAPFYGIMILLPLVLKFLSIAAPTTRLVTCKKCGWNRDFPRRMASPSPNAANDF